MKVLTIGNRKKRLCVRLRSEDKHHLRKSADRKAQISPVSRTNAFLICAFRSADFLRWCLSSERNLTHNLFFLFPIVFGINLIHFFSMRRRTVQPEIRSFVSVLWFPVTQPFDKGEMESVNFTKNGNCFNVLGNGKCELSANWEGRS